jgi:uronate dehydrogenase
MKRILITGAAGIVGRAIRPQLAQDNLLLLTDLADPGPLAPEETHVAGDLADPDFVLSVTRNVAGIVHLGGLVGPDYTFEEVLGPNIVGTHNVLEAARRNGVPRVVYASSAHCVGFYRRGTHLDHATFPRPNGEYAVSKAYGEMAASYYADNFGLHVLAIRIGYVGDDLSKERRLRTWVSPRDLAQLVRIGLTRDVGFEIVYGISNNPAPFFDNSNAARLGYRPLDNAADRVTDPSLLGAVPNLDSIEDGVVGGGFAAAGFAGDPGRILG